LLFYLQNSNAYLGWKRSERFTNSNTSAYIFSYDDLDKEMNVSLERGETPEPFTPAEENQLKEDNSDIPEITNYNGEKLPF